MPHSGHCRCREQGRGRVRAPGDRHFDLRADGRGFDRETAGAPSEKEFEIDDFRRVVRVGFGAHADQAIAQPPPQRAQALPFEAVERIAGRMRLRDRRAAQTLAPIVVMALRAGQVQLALAALENLPPGIDERPGLRIVGDGDRLAPRLVRDIGGQRQQLAAFERQRRVCWCSVRHRLMRCSRSIGRPRAASNAG